MFIATTGASTAAYTTKGGSLTITPADGSAPQLGGGCYDLGSVLLAGTDTNTAVTVSYSGSAGQIALAGYPDQSLYYGNNQSGAGQLSETTDRNGRATTVQYNTIGQETNENWYPTANTSGSPSETISDLYNPAGLLQTATDQNFVTSTLSADSFTYDMAGEVLTDTQAVPGLAPAVVLGDGYTNGNRTSLSANLGGTVNQSTSAVTGGTQDFLNNYSYTASASNPYGQMSQVSQTGNGGNAVAAKTGTFQYDLQAELTGVGRYQNANATANLVALAAYGRDNDGNLTSLVYANGSSTLPVYAWTYDSLGDMATASETLGGIVNAVSYTSDSTGQLLTATGGPAAEAFQYDTNGNRTSATTGTSTAQYTTGPNNEVLCDGTNSYAFDANGNCISQTNLSTGAQIQYAWDNRDRLVQVTFLNASGTVTQTVNYTYDAFNRWIGETVTTYSGQTSTTTQTRFAYDGNQIVLQFDVAGTGALTAANLSHRYLWGPAVDQLLADEQVANGDLVVWALGDNQNTVRDLATYSNGVTTVVNHRVFSAYGQLVSQTNAAVDCLFAYTGRPLDTATGLQNNDNRWYNAIIGRWLSQDPLGLGPDTNPYRYCGNEPTSRTDPRGLEWVWPWDPRASWNPLDTASLWTGIQGAGVVGGVQAEGGVVAGASAQGSVGAGVFRPIGGSCSGGTFESGGAFVGSPAGGSSAVQNPNPNAPNNPGTVIGASGGIGGGGFVTNAGNLNDIKGPFTTVNVTVAIFGLQISSGKGSNGDTIWFLSGTICKGIGLSVSAYPTTTK
jgi:RHS repeat-associated protein